MNSPDVVNILVGLSLAVNGWFLKGAADDLKEVRKGLVDLGTRVTILETRNEREE